MIGIGFIIKILTLNDRKTYALIWWLRIGRFSSVFVKKIIDLPYINLSLANVVSFIFLFLSVVVCMYNAEMITKSRNKIAIFLMGILIITSPIMALQNTFTLQCVEVNLGLLLLCLAFTFINKCILNKSKNYMLIIPILITTFVFGFYQTFDPLFITFWCLLYYAVYIL